MINSEELSELYPDWELIACGCCGGIQWGGEYPRECNNCRGDGLVYFHKLSKVLAQYPGGPFLGKMTKSELQTL